MKTITKLICLLSFVVLAWSAPGNICYDKYERILNILHLALELPIYEITEESTEGNMIVCLVS